MSSRAQSNGSSNSESPPTLTNVGTKAEQRATKKGLLSRLISHRPSFMKKTSTAPAVTTRHARTLGDVCLESNTAGADPSTIELPDKKKLLGRSESLQSKTTQPKLKPELSSNAPKVIHFLVLLGGDCDGIYVRERAPEDAANDSEQTTLRSPSHVVTSSSDSSVSCDLCYQEKQMRRIRVKEVTATGADNNQVYKSKSATNISAKPVNDLPPPTVSVSEPIVEPALQYAHTQRDDDNNRRLIWFAGEPAMVADSLNELTQGTSSVTQATCNLPATGSLQKCAFVDSLDYILDEYTRRNGGKVPEWCEDAARSRNRSPPNNLTPAVNECSSNTLDEPFGECQNCASLIADVFRQVLKQLEAAEQTRCGSHTGADAPPALLSLLTAIRQPLQMAVSRAATAYSCCQSFATAISVSAESAMSTADDDTSSFSEDESFTCEPYAKWCHANGRSEVQEGNTTAHNATEDPTVVSHQSPSNLTTNVAKRPMTDTAIKGGRVLQLVKRFENIQHCN